MIVIVGLIASMPPLWAEETSSVLLDWPTVQAQFQHVSPLLKMASMDVSIEGTRITEARSEYYPQLTAQWSSEYLKYLSNSSIGGPRVVGDSIIVSTTAFQHSASAQARWLLVDFGRRKRRVSSAKLGQLAKVYQESQAVREETLKLLNEYLAAWETERRLQLAHAVEETELSLLKAKKHLYEAGWASKLEVATASLDWINAQEKRLENETQWREALTTLSQRLQTPYEAHSTHVADIVATTPPPVTPPDVEALPEVKRLNATLKQKEQEASILFRERWAPTITAYGRFTVFGSDDKQPFQALTGVTPTSSVAGVTLSMPVFDGFKLRAQRERALLEAERLKLEKELAIQGFTTQWQQARQNLTTLEAAPQLSLDHQDAEETLGLMSGQLRKQALISHVEHCQNQLKLLQSQWPKIALLKQQQLVSQQLQLLSQTTP